jgi:choline dehydrogenase-like flavoprotein
VSTSQPVGHFFDASEHGVDAGEVDYLIIGSGAGGGAAARILAQTGTVAVLEQGPLTDKEPLSPVLNTTLAKLFRDTGRAATMGKVPIPMLQGSCVGGGTFINSAIIWRLPEKVLAKWHQDFGLAEGMPLAAIEAASAQLELDLSVNEIAPEMASRADLLMCEGAKKMGIEARTIRRNERGCKGSGRCIHGCPNLAKQSTAINSLRRAAEDGANIFANAGVRKIVFSGDRAVGVEGKIGGAGSFARRAFSLRAKKAVIVSASAVQSPALLARSGVKGAHLGHHFMSHPGTSVTGVYADRVDQTRGASQGYEVYGLRDSLGVKFESINVPPEVVAARLPGAGPRFTAWLEKLPYLGIWAAALRAEAEGVITPSRLFGESIKYDLTPNDLVRLRKGIRVLSEMHFQAGALEVMPGISGLPEALKSPDELKLIDDASLSPFAYSLLCTHLFGGCRAGRDPRASVVDPNLAVHGRKRLYVMDASIFPTNTGVNPQHSIMAITSVASARLAGN